jgi:hypothetical protein
MSRNVLLQFIDLSEVNKESEVYKETTKSQTSNISLYLIPIAKFSNIWLRFANEALMPFTGRRTISIS